jgi:GT2 family glycosyltransferase
VTAASPKVSVVVLTWNALDHTVKCLSALREITDHPSWRLIVVDNGSADGTTEWLAGMADVAVIANGANLGFTRGCNIGIAAAPPDEDIVLMNNDIVVEDARWLTVLQDLAYADDDTGVVGARLHDDRGRLGHAGSYMLPIAMRGHQQGGLELDLNQCTRDRPVESVSFALTYIRRSCIDRVGMLDEAFFAYYEDSDYCLRTRQAGLKVMFAGGATATHHGNATTTANGVDFWSVFNRSAKTFRRKWGQWLDHDRYEGELVWQSVVNDGPGYALQSRKLMQALHHSGMKVAYRNAFGRTDVATGDLLVDDILQRPSRDDVAHVAFSQADQFAQVRGSHKIGWSMLEVTGLPQGWVDGCNAMDEVWVPASFNIETFRQSGVTTPIRTMPLGVDVDYFHPRISGFRPSDRFVFLSVFEWGERKGPDVLLRAYAEEFKQSEDVLLLLSVYNRDPKVNVHHEVAKLDLGLDRCAPIVVMVNPEFADYQMGALYRSADCFVLPTRGEGWGMPVLEAMACGLPTVATNWSGPADFLHEGIGYPLQVRAMVPAKARCPFYTGFEWAEPDFDHLRFLMREIYDQPHRALAKGAAAATEVAALHSLEIAADRVKHRLLELT